MTNIHGYQLRDVVAESDQVLNVDVSTERDALGLILNLQGYGLCEMGAGDGSIVYLELHGGEAHLLVWADINSPDPTHVIPLGGAKESARVDDSNVGDDLCDRCRRSGVVCYRTDEYGTVCVDCDAEEEEEENA